MKIYDAIRVSALCCLAAAALAQQDTGTGLRGTVLDPSGASVPGAVVQVRGHGGELRKTTDAKGQYAFGSLAPGKYAVHITAKGFNPIDKFEFDITGTAVFDALLSIRTQAESVNVGDGSHTVSTDPANNGGALILREKELAALSDDPDELSQQLQAMAGPGAGPGGGQIYIDGFTGGEMPPKSSIREIRINSNPFSAEYDRPGFGRIEILTKPGSDKFHGQTFFQYNDRNFNSRSPLLTSALPAYQQRFIGGSFGGPLKTGKASFNLDFERRDITENAFILATVLDSNLLQSSVNKAVTTPQTRTSLSPRLDYAINASNTLTMRYQFTKNDLDKQGIGNYSLESQAYNTNSTEHTFQATESAILSASAVSETRFQFLRGDSVNSGAGTQPAVSVQGAFTGGSATAGNSGTLTTSYELANNTTWTKGTHVAKAGFRFRDSPLNSSSYNDFNGSFTFLGGSGPQLDASNRAIAGTSVALSALQVYQRTLLFQGLGYTDAQIRALGGGASQFSIGAGTASTEVNQYDLGFYVNDDWRMRPNLTLSYGLRYETQNNISDHLNFAPRIGFAWGIDSKGGKPGKTVLRAGIGLFYDRVAESYTLNALRYNGSTQESYVVMNPSFYPNVPTVSSLAASKQSQRLQPLYSGISAPQNWQANIGIDRQINSYFRVSANYITSRGIHLLNSRDVNAPVNGVYPYGDTQIRLLTESAGMSRSHQLFIGPNLSYKKLFLFGFYSLSYGKDNNEGQPADPSNLNAEWGRSTFADVRHRAILGTNVPLPWKVSVSPFMMFSSGTPYNITTGADPYLIGAATVRPSLVSSAAAASCAGTNFRYEAGFGCFNLNPAPGTAIARNYATGPGVVSINLRLARTWSFGNKAEATQDAGPGPGGPPPGGGGPGGPGGMFGGGGGKKYNLTLGAMANNAINHANYAAPSGDLSSPFFGQYRSLTGGFGPGGGGSSSYDRKITLQLRLSF